MDDRQRFAEGLKEENFRVFEIKRSKSSPSSSVRMYPFSMGLNH